MKTFFQFFAFCTHSLCYRPYFLVRCLFSALSAPLVLLRGATGNQEGVSLVHKTHPKMAHLVGGLLFSFFPAQRSLGALLVTIKEL